MLITPKFPSSLDAVRSAHKQIGKANKFRTESAQRAISGQNLNKNR